MALIHIDYCYKKKNNLKNNIFEKGPICWVIDKVIPIEKEIYLPGSKKLWDIPNEILSKLDIKY